MCTILGCAGPISTLSSKRRQEHHEFLSCLFCTAEARGRDAAGFWVWRGDHYVAEKRPYAAEDLIQRSVRWKGLRFNPGSLYLLHTRAATDGDPNDNVNNHPHQGAHSVMIHNGMVWNHEALAKEQGLDMKSECDSEILLRLMEAQETMHDGIKHMFQVIDDATSSASIATAVIDRRKPDRIYIARNSSGPCMLYHSKHFNCTFFVSTDIIFERALEMMYKTKDIAVIEATKSPTRPMWMYELHKDGSFTEEHHIKLAMPKPIHSRNRFDPHAHMWEGFDNDAKVDVETFEEAEHYITAAYRNRGYTVDVLGSMTALEVKNKQTTTTNNPQLNEMPMDIYEDLREYLDEKVKEL